MMPLQPVFDEEPLVSSFSLDDRLCDAAVSVPQITGETLSFAFSCSDDLELFRIMLVEVADRHADDTVTDGDG